MIEYSLAVKVLYGEYKVKNSTQLEMQVSFSIKVYWKKGFNSTSLS